MVGPIVEHLDLHPVVRAYAHGQLEDDERVRANERVRDHFSALRPERVTKATSVDSLRQTITIFRALTGCGRFDEAEALYGNGLGEALSPARGLPHDSRAPGTPRPLSRTRLRDERTIGRLPRTGSD